MIDIEKYKDYVQSESPNKSRISAIVNNIKGNRTAAVYASNIGLNAARISRIINGVYSNALDFDTEAPFERLLCKIYDMEEEHTRMIEKLLTFKKEAVEAIKKIPNQDERLILLYRYINNWSFADIGEKLNVDRHTAMRWHDKALAKFEIPENPTIIGDEL